MSCFFRDWTFFFFLRSTIQFNFIKIYMESRQYKDIAYRNISLRVSISYSRVGLQEPLMDQIN